MNYKILQRQQYPTPRFPSLDEITSPAVNTVLAAHYLNRKPQTLRAWACFQDGPIQPIRVNGRLAWRVADIKAALGV